MHRVYETTWNPPAEQQKVDVCMCKRAKRPRLTELWLSGQLFACISEWCRCDRLCLEPGLLLSLPAPLPALGSEVGREGE